jgi:hypothetical protein
LPVILDLGNLRGNAREAGIASFPDGKALR